MTPAEALLSRLEKVSKCGTGWKARCPAHNDLNPSLSIWENNDGSAGVKCYAGCTRDAVLSAVSLTGKDLSLVASPPTNLNGRVVTAAKPSNAKKRSAQTYSTSELAAADISKRLGLGSPVESRPYHDANGNEIARVYRWNTPDGKKEIRPVCRDGDACASVRSPCRGRSIGSPKCWQLGGCSSAREKRPPTHCGPSD